MVASIVRTKFIDARENARDRGPWSSAADVGSQRSCAITLASFEMAEPDQRAGILRMLDNQALEHGLGVVDTSELA